MKRSRRNRRTPVWWAPAWRSLESALDSGRSFQPSCSAFTRAKPQVSRGTIRPLQTTLEGRWGVEPAVRAPPQRRRTDFLSQGAGLVLRVHPARRYARSSTLRPSNASGMIFRVWSRSDAGIQTSESDRSACRRLVQGHNNYIVVTAQRLLAETAVKLSVGRKRTILRTTVGLQARQSIPNTPSSPTGSAAFFISVGHANLLRHVENNKRVCASMRRVAIVAMAR